LIFPEAVRVEVNPATAALILVDVQHWTCDPSAGLGRAAAARGLSDALRPFYARVDQAVPRMREALDGCRAAGMLVVHIRTAAQTVDGRDLSPKMRVPGAMPTAGSHDAQILERVAPVPGEVVLAKPASGICTGTGLDELLRNSGIQTVILVGVSVDGALEGSARSLTDRGYALILVPDACATFDERLQRGLSGMQTGIINIVMAADLRSRFAASGAQGPRVPAG
jgi:nicotinamidase-related amidase